LADAFAFDVTRWHQSEALAKKAIDLDKSLGEPHATLGFIRTFWEWDWKDGEREFKQALELSANYATAHQWYAIHLAINGRGAEAEVEMRRALLLDQTSAAINADMGQVLYFRREFDEAIAACDKALAIDQDFYNAHQYLYEIDCEKKLNDDAFAEVLKLSKAPGAATPGFSEEAQRAYHASGMKGFLRWQLQRLRTLGGDHYDRAEILARLGERDEAL